MEGFAHLPLGGDKVRCENGLTFIGCGSQYILMQRPWSPCALLCLISGILLLLKLAICVSPVVFHIVFEHGGESASENIEHTSARGIREPFSGMAVENANRTE